MPKRNRNQKRTRSRTMRGGVDFGSLWTSVKESVTKGAKAAVDTVQDTTRGAYATVTGETPAAAPVYPDQYNPPAAPVYPAQYNPPAAPVTAAAPVSTSVITEETYAPMGGRRRSRKMHGGYTPNTPTTGLAFYASPISDIRTAQPHNWVGGKTKRHRKHKKHSKSHKRRMTKSHKRMHHRK
jgi:hypothetical protein